MIIKTTKLKEKIQFYTPKVAFNFATSPTTINADNHDEYSYGLFPVILELFDC